VELVVIKNIAVAVVFDDRGLRIVAIDLLLRKTADILTARGMSGDDIRHGTLAGYQQECRCDSCKKAQSTYMKAWRAARKRRAEATSSPAS